MKRWKALVVAGGLSMSLTGAVPARAINIFGQCAADASSAVCKSAKGETDAAEMVKKIINLLLFALGIAAVLMIIWGGVKFTTSHGDPAGVKAAKDTVTYAVVGLIVALLAFAIVNFVVGAFTSTPQSIESPPSDTSGETDIGG